MKSRFAKMLLTVIITGVMAAPVVSQERPAFVTVTTIHWNMDYENFSMEEWKAVEKEYFDKVVMKNEYIRSALVLMHYFTADNSELKMIASYNSWEDIEKAQDRSSELEKEAWPDENAREAFFKKQSAYYSSMHSDEIYATVEEAKFLAEMPTEPMIYYLRVQHRAFPEDGKPGEMAGLNKEFKQNVIDKNSFVKGYYPLRHAWGSDGRDYVEAMVFESLGDIEKSFEENKNLVEAHWPDEKAREAFFEKRNKYFTGWHGDYIYRHVPELMKPLK